MDQNAQQNASPLTSEQIAKLVQDTVSAALKPVTDSLGQLSGHLVAQNKQNDLAMARRDYIANKMAGLPAVYTDRMPQTSDPVALANAEQDIRKMYQADFKLSGAKIPNVSGGNFGGMSLLDVPGNTTLTPSENISAGLARLPQM